MKCAVSVGYFLAKTFCKTICRHDHIILLMKEISPCSLNIGEIILFSVTECDDIDDDDGPYRGKLIGTFNTYHHQVCNINSELKIIAKICRLNKGDWKRVCR